jgi:hypothetical protein
MDETNFMSEFISAIVPALIIWCLAKLYYARVNKIEPDADEQIQIELSKEKLIPLTIELCGDEFFCYNSLTKDFVCQGKDYYEIKQRFQLRFPGKHAAIHQGTDHALQTLKRQMQDLEAKGQ